MAELKQLMLKLSGGIITTYSKIERRNYGNLLAEL
jgi:hypothetical protein